MGAVDLVIQVESPKSVTRGLQRVGRAGHELGEVSKGRIFPKFRADLLECAVVAKRMREGEIEETVIPRNPLDVLAQHLVSMVADDEWEVDEVEELVTARGAVQGALPRAARERPRHARRPLPVRALRRAAPAARLGPHRGHGPRPQGRPPARGHQRRHDPRPRPLRSPPPGRPPRRRARRGDGLRGAPGPDLPARRDHLADRGHHPRPRHRHPGPRGSRRGSVLARRRRRPPGRARAGDRRVLPRGGRRRRRRSWRKDYDLDPPRGREPRRLPARAAGGDPRRPLRRDDRRRALPRRDRRLAPLRPLALRRPRPRRLGPGALGRRSATSSTSRPTRSGPTTGSSSTCPTPTSRRPPTSSCSSPTRSRTWSSASSAARRCSAPASARTPPARLLLPRAYPGKRTPLWQQRLKSQNLLEVAKDFPRFPVILETYRECLRDVLDLPALDRAAPRPAVAQDHPGRGRDADAPRRSPPRCSSTTSPPTCTRATRRTPSAARPPWRSTATCSRELLGAGGAARADRPRGARGGRALAPAPAPRRAGEGPRRAAAGPAPARRPHRGGGRGADRRGLLGRVDAREARDASAARPRSGSPARSAGSPPRTPALYRDALGVPPPAGLPDSFLEEPPRRDARARPPLRAHPRAVPDGQIAARYGVDPTAGAAGARARRRARPRRAAARRQRARVVRRRRPAPAPPRQRRRACARRSRPADPAELARFLPAWQNVDAHRPAGAGPDRLREALVPLQGVALTPEVWERDVLPRRLGAYSPRWLDELTTSGEIVWIGAGPLGADGQGRALLPRGRPPRRAAAGEREARPARGRDPRRDPRAARDGAVVLARPRRRARRRAAEELHAALWDLAWAGEVTNDAFAPLRAPRLTRGRSRQRRRSAPLRRAPRPGAARPSRAAGR